MSKIKVGDYVTWRTGSREKKINLMPMGITGCKVVALGIAPDRKPAATIDCGSLFGTVNAYVADLELEPEPAPLPEPKPHHRTKGKQTILSGG